MFVSLNVPSFDNYLNCDEESPILIYNSTFRERLSLRISSCSIIFSLGTRSGTVLKSRGPFISPTRRETRSAKRVAEGERTGVAGNFVTSSSL